MLNGRDFALDRESGDDETTRYTRHLPDHWCFEERAFGGYTSALALAAVFAHTGRAAAASLSVMFVAPGTPGSLDLEVSTIRGGRTAHAVEVTITQGGRTILIASSWLADGWQGPPSVDAPIPFARYGTPEAPLPTPDVCPSLHWIGEEYPSMRFAHRRGVDYPEGLTTFQSRDPEVALWVAADGDPLEHPQIADVLHADAHLFDAPGKVTGFVETWLLSLDLNIVWQPGAQQLPSTAWRLLEARGSVASGAVSSYGSLRGPDGALLAVLTSQGLIR
ncbi:thioesterase family protein [Mycobacterium sp. NPDC051804]|uniref:thioesterase family protein n=1 Tax=Mycobacterium sp. NPDC051804 TaxID=3364295 RepID=UPI00378BFD73